MDDMKRIKIEGTAVSVRGDDIDTDRIIPARFLKCVTFDGLVGHAFEDDRAQLAERGQTHALDRPEHAGATLLFANKNFGCGSSREHAPQAIMRWGAGIRAIVGESFAEIFFGNCVALGIPCVTVNDADAQTIMTLSEQAPQTPFTLDLEALRLSWPEGQLAVSLPEGPRRQFLEGRWDSTAELLSAKDAIAETAATLPYFAGWR